jgi:hypothetical protein
MKLFHGNKKYGMDGRPKEIMTLGGDKGWWTEIATTRFFTHAAKIHRNEMDNNVWQRVVIVGNTVYGLNRPFVYPKIFEYPEFGL